MIVTLCCKTPDLIEDAISGIEDEDKKHEAKEACEKFVQWGEYLTVDINTETGTATVSPAPVRR